MGLFSWCQDKWIMMMRTKPHYISVLGRKRSSIRSPPKLSSQAKGGKRCGAFICVVTMLCSISHGVLLVLSDASDSSSLATYLVALTIAAVVAITSGLCLAEYIHNQQQEVPSIYSCCYQYSSEVLAFFIGWTWIVSQIAVISAICKVLTAHVNDWSNDIPRKFLENIFSDYAKDVPSLVFVLIFVLFIVTGFAETTAWYVLFVPITFVMIAAMYIIGCIISNSENTVADVLSFNNIEDVDQVISKSALCILFFSGPQSILRIPTAPARKNTTAVLGPLNGIILVIAFVFVMAATLSDKYVVYSSSYEILSLVSNVLCAICLSSIGIEAFYPLHYIIEDMSSDGLLFRSFGKKCRPFCFPVSSTAVHVCSFIFIGLMSVLMSLREVLYLVTVFPLLTGSIVPYLVLHQRYRDNTAWQYEPMFHTAANVFPRDRTRMKNEEFQYSQTPGFDITDDCQLSTTCVDERLTDSSSSDTDIDSVVQQYKEQTRITNMSSLESPITSSYTPEPTSSSSFRAKLCIAGLMILSIIVALTVSFCDLNKNFPALVTVLVTILISTIVQSLFICLPQNKKLGNSKGCCAKTPSMPWTPGMASMISWTLLVHALTVTWKVCLGSFAVGVLLYFFYGIRSSTAANSFYNMRTTHINLRPLPSYGNNCVSQIVPSQQKLMKTRKHKKLARGSL